MAGNWLRKRAKGENNFTFFLIESFAFREFRSIINENERKK